MAKQTEIPKKQAFRFTDPSAQSVQLVGDFTEWQKQAIPMHKGTGGVWTASVDLKPGMHHYLFIVDGEWCDDPECTLRVPNAYGGQNMVRKVV
ncbi:Glycoside hydrolase family 13 domain protein [Verrucomicrobia bacterium]|nr:Glycoside hydrolase family 13 domain protein [Verrucomicrobiota bacterium]